MLIPTDSPHTKRERFKTAVVFALWGPPIGAIPIILLFAFTGATHSNLILNITGAFGIVFYSYLPGIIPAMICGIIYQWWFYRPQPDGGRTYEVFVGFFIGYCTTAVLTICLFSLFKSDFGMSVWAGLIGGCSGAVCAYLDKRRRRKMHDLSKVEITDSL